MKLARSLLISTLVSVCFIMRAEQIVIARGSINTDPPEPVLTSLNFQALDSAMALGSNSLMVGVNGQAGSATGLTVTGAASANNYRYSVTYTGADFDGDSVNDTLTFEVLVEGLSGTVVDGKTLGNPPNGSIANASAVIGWTDTQVSITDARWVVGNSHMAAGETLKFSVVSASSSVGSVAVEGFSSVTALEGASHSHQAIIGEGTDSLDGYDFNNNLTMAVSPAAKILYVSAANGDTVSTANWGVGSIGFSLTVTVGGTGEDPGEDPVVDPVVEWEDRVDSNWNMPGNWSSGLVPGTAPGDVVVLSGPQDTPVVATVVETKHACSVQLIDEASLEVCDGDLLCDEISLGAEADMGGGHMKLWSSADVDVFGDLRVGDDVGATSVSSLQLISGRLAVDGELYVDKGVLEIGHDMTTAVDDCTLTSNATLRFDFDLTPASILEVAGHFSIASGAKLEIDLRGYNTGGNELELVRFSSVSGSFNPANITITGLGGGLVTVDSDSLNLTVIDDVAARSCNLWFVATGGTGTDPLDLQVNTGRRIRNLSSPDMSYSLAVNGNEKVYSASWSGSDFDGDGVNDTVSFDLRIEGFAGSTYSYDDGNASMTKLGASATVKGGSQGWGVGSDGDLDAGETLRFNVENLSLSTSGGAIEGFVGAHLVEPSGGNNHILIIGEGKNLQSKKSNFSYGIGFSPEYPLYVTSAANSKVAVNKVAFKLQVSDLPDFLDTETGDYSHYPTGPQHRSEYPPATHIDYPDWSWDTLQMSAGVHRNDEIPDDVANLMANTYPVISLGGRNFYGEDCVEKGVAAAAAKLKSFNPNVFVSTYKNAGLHHNRTCANAYFNEDEWTLYSLDADGNRVYDKIRAWFRYNHNHPEMREWWSDWCVARLADENIDSLFIDKATGGASALLNDDDEIEAGSNRVKSYISIRERMPEGNVLTGNILRTSYFGGNRELLHVFNSAYSEGWKEGNDDSLVAMSRADAICASLQMFREASVKGMMVKPNHSNLNHFILSGDEARAMINQGRRDEVIDIIRQEIQLPLAYHLIYLEAYSYFSFQVTRTGQFGDSEFLWNPKPYIDEFRNPLGEPLGPPVKKGYIFTRSFEHVDVWLNVENEECVLTWDWMPIADAQAVSVDENNSTAITLTGSDSRETDLTYAVSTQPTHGVLSGTAPNLVYSPNADFVGEDSFTFKTYNDIAESWKATVTITVNEGSRSGR